MSPVRCEKTGLMMLVLVCLMAMLAAGCGGKAPGKSTDEALDTPGKVRLAESYFGSGRPKESLDVIEEAIRDDPENAGLRNYQGLLFLRMGRLEPAEKAFHEALRIDEYMTDA